MTAAPQDAEPGLDGGPSGGSGGSPPLASTAGGRAAAAIHNSAVAAWAIAAAWEIGALDELHRSRTLDAAAIAYACREIDELCYAPTFWDAMGRLDFEPSAVVDLGCGSGGRLLDVLAAYPRARGIGIDIARPALDAAWADSSAAGMSDRVTFLGADVLDMQERPEFADVELIGDATRIAGITLGFELGHDLMGVFLPTVADWESVFDEAGWKLARTNKIDVTVGEVVFELE
jgi:SAM-dependent methyltransferase